MNLQFSIDGIDRLTAAVNSVGNRVSNAAGNSASTLEAKNRQSLLDWQAEALSNAQQSGQKLRDRRGRFVSATKLTEQAKEQADISRVLHGLDDDSPLPKRRPTSSSDGGGNAQTTASRYTALAGSSLRYLQTGSAYSLGTLTSIAGKMGPFGIAVTTATAALATFAQSLLSLVQAMNEYGNRRTAARATPEQQAILDAAAEAMQIKPEELSNIAKSRPGGATQLINEIRAYLSKPERARQFYADSAKLPPEISRLDYLPKNRLKNVLEGKDLYGNTYERSRAEEGAAARMSDWWNSTKHAVSKWWERTFLKPSGFDEDAKKINDKMSKRVPMPVGNENSKIKDAADKMNEAANKFIESTNLFADTMSYTNKRGIFGGIDSVRANRGYPSNWAWTFEDLRKKNQQDILYNGAFVY